MAIDSNELLGRALGSCTLKRLIGRGGMGAVYLAQQSRPRRTVAVKVVLPGIVLEQKPRVEFLARFRREADAIAALDHINIMPVYEYGEQGDTAYLVMPYVTGGTLRDLLEKRGTLSMEEVVPILEQTAAGLDSAHAQSIIHRDLKPGNILFHADGRVLLADFGLAKVLKDVTENESHGHLTSIGTIIGTPEYLSPEQGTGDAVDYRTDIYSLGVVVYQMLAGRVPFAGPSPVAIAIKHALEDPPPPSRFNPAIPENVEAVVMKAIAKKPAQRYESAGAFAQALRQAVEEALQDSDRHVEPVPQPTSAKPTLLTSNTNGKQQPKAELASGDETLTEVEQKTPTTREHDPAMSTVLMKDALDSIQSEEIQEAIQDVPLQQPEHVQAVPGFAAYSDATMADAPAIAQPLRLQPISEQPAVATSKQQPEELPSTEKPGQIQTAVQSTQAEQQTVQTAPILPTRPRGRVRPLWMTIIGGALLLLLIGGGAATYIQGQSASRTHGNNTTPIPVRPKATQTEISNRATPTTIPRAKPTADNNTPLPGPSSGVAGIGSQIYGTTKPGKDCDTRGGQWNNTDNARLVCNQDALEITNTGNTGNQLAGTFLTRLPNNQAMPGTYVVQTEVTSKSNSQSPFGVAFYNQSGAQSTSYAFIIDTSTNTWTANYYNKGQIQRLHTQSLQTPVAGTVTIDVVVSGNNYYLYVNGTQQGMATSGYGNTSGNIGLVVEPGADVAFKNTLLYTTIG